MLVLERKTNEQVIVGDYELTITVTRISDGRVHLGFEAPDHVKIERPERLTSDGNSKAVSK